LEVLGVEKTKISGIFLKSMRDAKSNYGQEMKKEMKNGNKEKGVFQNNIMKHKI